MGVVQLDGGLLGQQIPIGVVGAETADDVVDGAGAQKILLQETQLPADRSRIVGVQHSADRLRRQRRGDRAHKIAVAELMKVERAGRAGGPQPQGVDGLAAIANDRTVKGDSQKSGRLAGYGD
jgi:hypothetical protein